MNITSYFVNILPRSPDWPFCNAVPHGLIYIHICICITIPVRVKVTEMVWPTYINKIHKTFRTHTEERGNRPQNVSVTARVETDTSPTQTWNIWREPDMHLQELASTISHTFMGLRKQITPPLSKTSPLQDYAHYFTYLFILSPFPFRSFPLFLNIFDRLCWLAFPVRYSFFIPSLLKISQYFYCEDRGSRFLRNVG
jgi:hypothetical protein